MKALSRTTISFALLASLCGPAPAALLDPPATPPRAPAPGALLDTPATPPRAPAPAALLDTPATPPRAPAPAAVIDLSHLTPAEVRQLSHGPIPAGTTVYVPANYVLPLELAAHGDVVVSVGTPAPVLLRARRDIWIRVDGEAVVFSLDGHTFHPSHELFSGSLTASLSQSDQGALKAKVSTELRIKSN